MSGVTHTTMTDSLSTKKWIHAEKVVGITNGYMFIIT